MFPTFAPFPIGGPVVHDGSMTDISHPRVEGTVRLADGRHIGFAEFGVPDGRPVLWFHGTPGAKRQIPPHARDLAVERGVRLIGIERPGTGRSTSHRYDALIEYADDIAELADHLGFERFGVVGLSGGGPYVLACAAALPDRVVCGAVLGGIAPTRGDEAIDGGAINLATRFSGPFEFVHAPFGTVLSTLVRLLQPVSSQAFDLYMKTAPEGDQRVFERPEMKEMFLDDLALASETGIRALVYDVLVFTKPWGFALKDIEVPVHFWHGDADNLVPLEHAEHQAGLVPLSSLTVRPGESHLGGLDAAEEILETILAEWEAPGSTVRSDEPASRSVAATGSVPVGEPRS